MLRKAQFSTRNFKNLKNVYTTTRIWDSTTKISRPTTKFSSKPQRLRLTEITFCKGAIFWSYPHILYSTTKFAANQNIFKFNHKAVYSTTTFSRLHTVKAYRLTHGLQVIQNPDIISLWLWCTSSLFVAIPEVNRLWDYVIFGNEHVGFGCKNTDIRHISLNYASKKGNLVSWSNLKVNLNSF